MLLWVVLMWVELLWVVLLWVELLWVELQDGQMCIHRASGDTWRYVATADANERVDREWIHTIVPALQNPNPGTMVCMEGAEAKGWGVLLQYILPYSPLIVLIGTMVRTEGAEAKARCVASYNT